MDILSNYSGEIVIASTLLIGIGAALVSQNPVRAAIVNGDQQNADKKNAALNGVSPAQVNYLMSLFPASMQKRINGWIVKVKFGREALSIKKTAKSMNHWMTLLGKLAMGLPIKPTEDEVDSYLDIADALGPQFPFMWEVDNVRSKDAVSVSNGYDSAPCRIYSSYGYLDLLRNEEVQNAAIDAAKIWASGNHGPRMLGGNTAILRKLEKELAAWLGREDALTCSAGYLACLSAPVALMRKGMVVLADDRCHASLRAGLKLCGAKVIFFKHNDFADAEAKAAKFLRKVGAEGDRSRGWVLIESVYSMDGDLGDLPSAVKLARKWGLKIMVDEAHGLGVLGKTGRGIEEHFGYPQNSEVSVVVGTFSKSFSSVGGYIVADQRTVRFLAFYAPGNVFSAPLSAYHAAATLKALEIIRTRLDIIKLAQDNSKYMRKAMLSVPWPADYAESLKYELEGEDSTCVLPVIFPNDPIRMFHIAEKLRQAGFQIASVCAPACPVRRPRFRLTATSAYSKKDMDDFAAACFKFTVETPSMAPSIIDSL